MYYYCIFMCGEIGKRKIHQKSGRRNEKNTRGLKHEIFANRQQISGHGRFLHEIH